MKMNKKDFDALCEAIEGVMENHSLPVIIKCRQNINYAKDQFVSFCWHMFHASKFDAKGLYNHGLNDTHIETALKRILSDFA